MILIRRAGQSDAAGIAHVHVESWRTTYAGIVPDAYLEGLDEAARATRWLELLNEQSDVLVAEREGRIVGFVAGGAIRTPVEDCNAELYAIYMLKGEQRTRIGTALVRELARSLMARGFTSMSVWVLAQNGSKRFYEQTGAHYAMSKEIEIGDAVLMEEAWAWPDLTALASLG